ncbi:two pore segment channel 3 isoform 3-T3 [Synchiropus picturatus]
MDPGPAEKVEEIPNGRSSGKTEEDLNLAAIYVSDAQYNRNIFFHTSPRAVRLYLWYNHWLPQVLVYVFILANLSLALFEEPALLPLPTWVKHHAAGAAVCAGLHAPPGPLRLRNSTTEVLERRQEHLHHCGAAAHAGGHDCVRSTQRRQPLRGSLVSGSTPAPADQRHRGATVAQGLQEYQESAASDLLRLPALHLQHPHLLPHGPQTARETEEVRQLLIAKRHKMVRAFAVLQEVGGASGEPVVTRDTWNRLLKLVQSDVGTAHRELLWSVCDHQNQGTIGKAAFMQLADLLNIEVITLKSRPHPLLRLVPAVYQSGPSRLIRRAVQHRAFVVVYDVIILVNAVFIGLDEENPIIANFEWGFLALYLLEIVLKLYVFEPRAFFSRHKFWNWFDTIIVVAALVATIINSTLKSAGNYSSRQVLDIVFILRVLRLIRVVDSIKRFRTIINTLVRIGPAILTFGQLILVVYYIFAMVGMELFKDKVKFLADTNDPARLYCGNPDLQGSTFAQLNYCKNNFNDVVSSFVLLVELMVVNQWHVLSSGFSITTHASARIFFILFHIIVVILILNIFVAFILEAFYVEYSVEKGDLQTSLEKKIQDLELGVEQEKLEENMINSMETDDDESRAEDSRPSLKFKIASKRYRTVDALLQRMFEADLLDELSDSEDQGGGNFSNPAFDSA